MRRLTRSMALAVAASVLLAGEVFAGTYYIDYSGGNDANKGTSKSTPWKRAPYMKGFSGSYSHAAGDRFIFKGGVTWPVGVFQMKITAGGSSNANRDYYGVDREWFSGNAFTRPLFDFEHKLVGAGWTLAAGILVSADYITFDGLEMANHRAPLGQNGISNWGSMTICLSDANWFTLTNCLIRDWDQPTVGGTIPNDTFGGGAIMRVNSGANNVISHCEFHQVNVAAKTGTVAWNIAEMSNCHVHHICSAFLYGQLFRNNHVHDIVDPADLAAHSNVALCPGGLVAYNNLIHDVEPRAQVIYLTPGYYGASSDLIYNNVVYNVAQPCIVIDTDGSNNQKAYSRIYNNTLIGPAGTGLCIRVAERGNGPFPLMDARNNHLITSGAALLYNNPAAGGASVSSLTLVANCIESPVVALANGFSVSTRYAPISDRTSTIKVGLDLSNVFQSDILGTGRPAGGWDIGAYQYTGAGSTPAPRANAQPVIGPIQHNAVDAATGEAGLQVAEGTSVTLSAAINDADGDTINWTWSYSINGGQFQSYASGSGSTATASFSSPTGGRVYRWKIRATDGVAAVESQFEIGVITISIAGSNGTIAFEAEGGILQAPFFVSGGSIVQTSATAIAQGGRASYTFAVPTAGTYTVSALVDAPTETANSFFVSIDSEPQDPASIWHVPVASGFQQRTVSLQGNGTEALPELAPRYFQLGAGQHTLVVIGREAGTRLDRITLVRHLNPPRNFRIASGQ